MACLIRHRHAMQYALKEHSFTFFCWHIDCTVSLGRVIHIDLENLLLQCFLNKKSNNFIKTR